MSERNQVIIYGIIASFLALFFALFSYLFEIYIVMMPSMFFGVIAIIIFSELRKKQDYPEWPDPPNTPSPLQKNR